MELNEPNDNFDFSQLKLSLPTSIQGGAYFTKYLYNSKPLYIQTPKSATKQGFVKNGKKYHSDLMFDNSAESFIHWIEKLEEHSQQLIFSNAENWFQNELTLNDIEEAFNTSIKVYKSGTCYLLRVYSKISSVTQQPLVKIYDEYEKPVTLKKITNKTNVLSILEFQGIKFTSRSFQIEVEVKQMMLVKEDDLIFENCLIKKTNVSNISLEMKNKQLSFMPVEDNVEDNVEDKVEDNVEDNVEENVEDKVEENVEDKVEESNDDLFQDDDLSVLKIEDLDFDEHIENTNDDNSHTKQTIDEKEVDTEPLQITDLQTTDNTSIDKVEVEDKIEVEDKVEVEDKIEVEDKVEVEEEEQSSKDSQTKTQEPNDIDILNIEDLEPDVDIEEIKELEVPFSSLDDKNPLESITLKNPNQVYFDLYKEAKKKAKEAKKNAILAYLELKNIKKTYVLEDMNDSDSEINSDFSESEL